MQLDCVEVDRRVDDEIYIALIEKAAEEREGITAVWLIHHQPTPAGSNEFSSLKLKRGGHVAQVADDVLVGILDYPPDVPTWRTGRVVRPEMGPFLIRFREQSVPGFQGGDTRIVSKHRLSNL